MSFATQALVFLTHRQDQSVLRHFLRLRQETKDVLASFLCVHERCSISPENALKADFTVQLQEAARLLPGRYALFQQSGTHRFENGFCDLLYVPVLMSSHLAMYEYVWLIEYDVDYAGHWSRFFFEAAKSRADFLGTTIFSREQCPSWLHWRWFSAPEDVMADVHLRSFTPIVRFSRRMLERYIETVRDPHWGGHHEALYPTIARRYGLSIQDIGGTGPYCPPEWQAKHYSNNPRRINLTPGTFVFRPVRSDKYYHEVPDQFAESNFLYHPVKTSEA